MRELTATFLTFCHPTFYVLPPLLQAFLEAESVVVADPEAFALVFAAAELSPEAVALAAELSPEVVSAAGLSLEAVVLAAEPVWVAGLSPEVVSAAELSPEAVVLAAEPVWVVGPVLVLEPVFVVEAVFDVAEPQVSVDIAVVFVVLAPVSVVAVEVDSSGRPKFFAFPNICSFPNCSNSVEVVG